MTRLIFSHQKFKERRRSLRREATLEERILWNYLKGSKMKYKFRRQVGIGIYIVDFFCPELSLVIELDGVQHLENKVYDLERDNYLKNQGCTILRFWNADIHKDLENVIITIENIINTTPPRFTRHPS